MTSAEKDLARVQRRSGELEAACSTLEHAIAQESDERELAELYGLLGGTRREQGRLAEAIAAYDLGATYESSGDTYNELNRLVTRIIRNPTSLTVVDGPGDTGTVDVHRELVALLPRLGAQLLTTRAGDVWALGDLALVRALTGDTDGAISALQEFPRSDSFALGKYLETFAALAELDTPRKAGLGEVTAWVRDRLASPGSPAGDEG